MLPHVPLFFHSEKHDLGGEPLTANSHSTFTDLETRRATRSEAMTQDLGMDGSAARGRAMASYSSRRSEGNEDGVDGTTATI